MQRPTDAGRLAPVWLERAVLAALVVLFVWKGWLPAWRQLNSDFPNYYLSATLYRDGFPLDRLYETIWAQRQKDHAGLEHGLVGFIPLTLFSALIVAPFAWLPALAAKHAWMVLSLAMLAGVAALLRRLAGLSWRHAGLCIFLSVVPLRTNFLFGQQHVLVLLLVLVAAWLYARQRKLGAGVAVAVAAALKLYPGMLGFMLLRKRQWRALLGLAGAGALLGVLALWLFGWEAARVYAFRIVPRVVLTGEMIDPYDVHVSSFAGLLRRLFVFEPALNPRPLLDAPAAFAVLRPLVSGALLLAALGLVKPRDAGGREGGHEGWHEEGLDWARFLGFTMLLSSGSATYHYCLLIASTGLALGHFLAEGRWGRARALLALHALVSFPYQGFVPQAPEGWATFLGYPRVYALAAYCVFLASRDGARARATAQASPADPGAQPIARARRELAAIGVALGAIVAIGAASGLRSLRAQMATYPLRIPGAGASMTNLEPAAASAAGEVLFTRLGDEQYLLDRAPRPLRVSLPFGTDLFHPVVAPSPAGGGRELLVEVSGRTSRIARVDLGALDSLGAPEAGAATGAAPLALDHLRLEVDGAERPAVSADGRWLAFSRPARGRGDLWLSERGAPSGARQLLPPAADVLDYAVGAGGRLVVSARPQGRPRLFHVDPVSGALAGVRGAEGDARYPALSPDGRRLAFARDEARGWQLWLLELGSGQARPLTAAPCNATDPAWTPDGSAIVFATDCGRGLDAPALARLAVPR